MSIDTFVGYTGVDQGRAEWIAFALEAAGLTTAIRARGFRPGANFVPAMQDAAPAAERAIMALSPAYTPSGSAAPERVAAFAADPG